jgi:hypothetical protein
VAVGAIASRLNTSGSFEQSMTYVSSYQIG